MVDWIIGLNEQDPCFVRQGRMLYRQVASMCQSMTIVDPVDVVVDASQWKVVALEVITDAKIVG
jgi:hypothetical protein